jgi:hypothetical protein
LGLGGRTDAERARGLELRLDHLDVNPIGAHHEQALWMWFQPVSTGSHRGELGDGIRVVVWQRRSAHIGHRTVSGVDDGQRRTVRLDEKQPGVRIAGGGAKGLSQGGRSQKG